MAFGKVTMTVFGMALNCVLISELSAVDQEDAFALKAFGAHADKLSNLIADYDVTTTHAKPAPTVVKGPANQWIVERGGEERDSKTFAGLQGRSRYALRRLFTTPPADSTVQLPVMNDTIDLFGPSRAERLTISGDSGKFKRGTISEAADLPRADIELALGLRGFDGQERFTSASVRELGVRQSGDGLFIVHLKVKANVVDEWELDRNLGYAPRIYRRVVDGAGVAIEVKGGDYRLIDGVMVPHVITMNRNFIKDGVPVPMETSKVSVTSVQIGSPDNNIDDYAMKWPEGTEVLDKRLDLMFVVRNGVKRIDDDQVYERSLNQLPTFGAISEVSANPASSSIEAAKSAEFDAAAATVAPGRSLMKTSMAVLGAFATIFVALVLIWRLRRAKSA